MAPVLVVAKTGVHFSCRSILSHQSVWWLVKDYMVDYDGVDGWCAYTEGVKRVCYGLLHPAPAVVEVLSEVHDDAMNPLDTTFNEVRFKDPSDNVYKLSDGTGGYFYKNPPYAYFRYLDYFFHTYRYPVVQYLPDILRE